MLVTYFLESAVCLSIGSVFEDDQCAEIPIKKIILCIHRFAEAFSLAAQLFFTIERVLSIQFSKIQRTLFFKLFFLAGFVFENGFAISYVYTNVILGTVIQKNPVNFHFLGGYGLFWLVTFQLAVIANFPVIFPINIIFLYYPSFSLFITQRELVAPNIRLTSQLIH